MLFLSMHFVYINLPVFREQIFPELAFNLLNDNLKGFHYMKKDIMTDINDLKSFLPFKLSHSLLQ